MMEKNSKYKLHCPYQEHIPNEETIKAIEEARNQINLEKIDDLDKFLDTL